MHLTLRRVGVERGDVLVAHLVEMPVVHHIEQAGGTTCQEEKCTYDIDDNNLPRAVGQTFHQSDGEADEADSGEEENRALQQV